MVYFRDIFYIIYQKFSKMPRKSKKYRLFIITNLFFSSKRAKDILAAACNSGFAGLSIIHNV